MSILLRSHRNLTTAIRYAIERNTFSPPKEKPEIESIQKERKDIQEKICSSLLIYPSWSEGLKRIRKIEGLIPNIICPTICSLRKDLVETAVEYNENIWKRNNVLSYPIGIKKVEFLPGKILFLPFEVSYGEKQQNLILSSSLYVFNIEEGVYIHIQPEEREAKIYTYSFEETDEELREISC